MAILICPSCGGKVSSTRSSCSHCGHEMEATKICPECEESIDANATECPVCGYNFDNASENTAPKAEPVVEEVVVPVTPPPAQGSGNKKVCTFHRLATKEEFLRSVFFHLTKHEKSPVDILNATFGEVEEDTIQGFVAQGTANGHYSATIGYDRIEKYVVQEFGFVGSNMHYTLNGHPKVGTGERVMRDVEKTRTVTDWQPYNGNVINEKCDTVMTEPAYTEWTFLIRSLISRTDLASIHDEEVETTHLSDEVYSVTPQKLSLSVEAKISFPGDQIKDKHVNISISDYSLFRCIVPIYRVYFEYNGQKYCAKGIAVDGIAPIVEIPQASESVPTEERLIAKRNNEIRKETKPFDIIQTICYVFLGISAFTSCGLFAAMWAVGFISLGILGLSIGGGIFLGKIISKKTKAIEEVYSQRIDKVKELKGLLLHKKMVEYKMPELTQSETIHLDLLGVDFDKDFDIDTFLAEASVEEEEVSDTLHPKKVKSDKKTRLAIGLNISSIALLFIGIIFLVCDKTFKIYINSDGLGKVCFGYFEKALLGDIFALLVIGGAFVTLISSLVQLYFDISKTSSFKKSLITTVITTVFNVVATVFAFISPREWETWQITVFAIISSVCLLPTITRLILIAACKAECDDNGCGSKKAAIIWSSALLFVVLLATILFQTIQKGDRIPVRASYNYRLRGMISLVIPDGVTEIEDSAFIDCRDIRSIVIPDSVTKIGNRALSDCYITSFTGPASALSYINKSSLNTVVITSGDRIGSRALYDCDSLTSVTIPNSVTTIGDYAFDGCDGLTSVTIPNSVTTIGSYAFYDCSNLTSVTIPNSVTSIGDYAFSDCTNLTSIVIPNGVTSIGDYAFDGCTGLTSITIPDSVTSIGSGAFNGCDNLTIIEIGENNSSIKALDGNVYSKDGKTLIQYISKAETSFEIPEGVTSIGDYAFSGCTNLTSIVIPEGVIRIGDNAFNNCDGLTSIVIPEGVTRIGVSAFYNCDGLTSIVIPDSVISIGNYAFLGCPNLTSFTGPASALSSIIKSTLKTVVITSGDSIKDKMFSDCTGLTSIVIPEGVTSIGDYAFYNCSKLTSIVIPDSVTSIGSYAFDRCWPTNVTCPAFALSDINKSYLKTVVITSGDRIKTEAFRGCNYLTSVTIPNSVTSIGDYAFYNCFGLTSIVIPDSVTSIGNNAFSYCDSLKSITIPNSVTSIGSGAFHGCDKFTSVTCPAFALSYISKPYLGTVVITSGDSIESQAFYNCDSLKSIVIPEGVTSIGASAFYGCSRLTSIVIPDSVTSIGNHAFDRCSELTSVYYTGTESDWSEISIDSGNSYLNNATKFYYSESAPTTSGNYWHYDENGNVVVW